MYKPFCSINVWALVGSGSPQSTARHTTFKMTDCIDTKKYVIQTSFCSYVSSYSVKAVPSPSSTQFLTRFTAHANLHKTIGVHPGRGGGITCSTGW